MKKTSVTKNSGPQTKKLSHTLLELEQALNQWNELSMNLIPGDEKRKHPRDASLINETKKLLSQLKIQIAELDR